MQYLELEFDKWCCAIEKYSDVQMYLLGEFFHSEVSYDSTSWINWLECMKSRSLRGNRIWLERLSNNYIAMGDETMESPDDFTPVHPNCLIIKVSELFKLLKKWNELHAQKVQKIKITKDGETFEMCEIAK